MDGGNLQRHAELPVLFDRFPVRGEKQQKAILDVGGQMSEGGKVNEALSLSTTERKETSPGCHLVEWRRSAPMQDLIDEGSRMVHGLAKIGLGYKSSLQQP